MARALHKTTAMWSLITYDWRSWKHNCHACSDARLAPYAVPTIAAAFGKFAWRHDAGGRGLDHQPAGGVLLPETVGRPFAVVEGRDRTA